MSPDSILRATVRKAPLARADESVGDTVDRLVESELPALPVVDGDGRLVGIFGEREFIGALFPGYLSELHSAAFVPGSIDEVIEQRLECRAKPVAQYVNSEHVDAGEDFSDTQLAETFLHHRVLIIPVVDSGQVRGIVTRSAFFRALVERVADSA